LLILQWGCDVIKLKLAAYADQNAQLNIIS